MADCPDSTFPISLHYAWHHIFIKSTERGTCDARDMLGKDKTARIGEKSREKGTRERQRGTEDKEEGQTEREGLRG